MPTPCLLPPVPELAYAQIDGTVAVQATLELPAKKLTVQPRLQGMAVEWPGRRDVGLAQKQPAGRGLPHGSWGNSLLARAVIAAEDQRFYEHTGYDLAEMTQALHSNQAEDATLQGSEHALAASRQAPGHGWRTLPVRKLRELLYAVEMEQTLGKARILQLYLSHAPGCHRVRAQAAAHTYFGKRADQLTAAQAVWLAAMLHNPALEAQRWKARGSINLERAQWVAAGCGRYTGLSAPGC